MLLICIQHSGLYHLQVFDKSVFLYTFSLRVFETTADYQKKL